MQEIWLLRHGNPNLATGMVMTMHDTQPCADIAWLVPGGMVGQATHCSSDMAWLRENPRLSLSLTPELWLVPNALPLLALLGVMRCCLPLLQAVSCGVASAASCKPPPSMTSDTPECCRTGRLLRACLLRCASSRLALRSTGYVGIAATTPGGC